MAFKLLRDNHKRGFRWDLYGRVSSFFKNLINENTNKVQELKQHGNQIIESEYIRKTYVLSEKALKILDQEAKKLKRTGII